MAEGWARIGWVVDVQNDFMLPPEEGGRLYVSDLTDPWELLAALQELVRELAGDLV